jgi:transcriptional regulator with XRE-family HTH domain
MSGVKRWKMKAHEKQAAKRAIAKRIREARERNGWTQAQVAEWTGLTPSNVSHFESGQRAPSALGLARIARGLRVSADWILGLETKGEP